MINTECLICGRGDSVQRVSTMRHSDEPAQLVLAKKFSPPQQPIAPVEPQFMLPPIAFMGAAFLSVALASGICYSISVPVGQITGASYSVLGGLATLIVNFVVFCVSVYLIWKVLLKTAEFFTEAHIEKMNQYRVNKDKYVKIDFPRWQKAINRWNSIYYCYRCDVVYIPGDSIRALKSEDIIALCYYVL